MQSDPASPLKGKRFLVGLGAQRAGSTWLTHYLRAHPDVFVSGVKELHYFDAIYVSGHAASVKKLLARQAKAIIDKTTPKGPHAEKETRLKDIADRTRMSPDGDYSYIRFFEDRVAGESVFCDITPAYSMLDARGYEAITKMHPDVRFVFVMRDPVDRFWSALKRKRRQFDPYEAFTRTLEKPGAYLRTDYQRTILELEKVVPSEHIQYFFFETLFTQDAMDVLASFLGVRPWPADPEMVANRGRNDFPLRPDHVAAALSKFRHVYEFVFDRFGDATPARWRSRFA